MSKSDVAVKSMDVTARSVDLLNTLAAMVSNPQSIVHAGIELGRWLGREQLSENQLQFCLEKARGLAIANSKGNRFYEAVIAGTRERAVGPLFVQPSGSLGRMMAKDPYLCWMISTVTCLFEFHGENFISDVLCSFIMQANILNEGKPLKEYQLAWHPLRLQLKPVLDKIVSSIWFNVVNSGIIRAGEFGSLTSLQLPSEINAVCPRGHNLESHKLGEILSQLRNAKGEIFIESQNVISNLTLWLIYHFKGRLKVIVSGRIVYDHTLGTEKAVIEHRTQKFCSIDGTCESEKITPKVKMFCSNSGKLKKTFASNYDTQMTLEQSPRARQKLYQEARYPARVAGGESIRVLTRQTAKEIIKWLLNLRVRREAAGNDISFKVLVNESEEDESGEDLRVSVVLARVPQIINMGWGHIQAAVVVFSSDEDEDEMELDGNDDDKSSEYTIQEARPENIIRCFPIIRDLMMMAANSCRCYDCKSKKASFLEDNMSPGCLRYVAFMEVMVYIAHAVADAFGADDCSAHVNRDMTDFGAMRILSDVIEGFLRWKSWFDTASRVVLGCPSLEALTDTKTEEDYTLKSDFMDAQLLVSSVVAIQHGNLAVVAPWLDISQPLSVSHCFGFKVIQGRLGIVPGNGSHFQSLQSESAVIETQHTDSVESYTNSFPHPAKEIGSHVALQRDDSEATSDFILVPTGSTCYKLLMRVITASHSRLLDPARAMIKTTQPVMSISCTHKFDRLAQIQESDPVLKLYSYDELLGRWPDSQATGDATDAPRDRGQAEESENENEDYDEDEEEDFPAGQYHRIPSAGDEAARDKSAKPTIRVSQVLDSYLQYNTALAIAYDDVTILNHRTACLECILKNGMDVPASNGVENIDRNRWIICSRRNMTAGTYGDDNPRRDAMKMITPTAQH